MLEEDPFRIAHRQRRPEHPVIQLPVPEQSEHGQKNHAEERLPREPREIE